MIIGDPYRERIAKLKPDVHMGGIFLSASTSEKGI